MLRRSSFTALTVVFLLLPARLIAGGPPSLSLPIDGVTADNAKACADLLTEKLDSKLTSHPGPHRGVALRQHAKQWYLTFYMGDHVALSDIDAALKGSAFSVPRDKLRPFGHVVLEIDAGKTPSKKLPADLATLDHVSVATSESKDNRLLVTVDMPYPVEDGGSRGTAVAWTKFQRNDLSSDPATKSESPTTARALPTFGQFRDLMAKHKADLKDIRWSTNHACRSVGCVVAAEASVAVSAK